MKRIIEHPLKVKCPISNTEHIVYIRYISETQGPVAEPIGCDDANNSKHCAECLQKALSQFQDNKYDLYAGINLPLDQAE